MNVITKVDRVLPSGSVEYLVHYNGKTISCFNSKSHDHPITSRDAFYDNLVEYYMQRNIKIVEG